jgi:hypothetical protein
MMEIDKRERILRVILNYPKGSISTYRIAKEAECSRSWAIAFLHKLEKMKLVKKISNISESNRKMEGTCVIDVMGLFNYWIEISHPLYIREYHVKNPIHCLEKTSLNYALTTYQAETLTQNYLFPSRTDLFVREEDVEKWHKLFTKNGLTGKGNVKIIIEDEHVFYKSKQKKGFKVVSIPQLIVDLLKEGGVAEEAAIMLMRKKYNEII